MGEIDIDLERIIPKRKVQEFHRDFDRVRAGGFRRRMVFFRMNLNRIVQSSIIILSNPFIWRFVIKDFFMAVRGHKSVLRSLEIAATYRCNSNCEQCSCRLSLDPEREKNEKLTLDEIKDVIDQAVEMGAFQFCINGGEPLLEMEKVRSLTEYIKKHHGRYVHLCTNGTLLTEEKIAGLKAAGLDSIEMGFDSAFEEKHDENRLTGSYKKILQVIKICGKYKIKVILNTILTNSKVQSDDIIYTFHIAKKLGCLLQITPCCLTGALKNRTDMMLTEDSQLYFHWLLSKPGTTDPICFPA